MQKLKTVDPWFIGVVVAPFTFGLVLLLYALAWAFLPLVWGGWFGLAGVACVLWAWWMWRHHSTRIETNQWVERYWFGDVSYISNSWMLYLPSYMTTYVFDSRTRETRTGTTPGSPTTVVAQIFLAPDNQRIQIVGTQARLSQPFILGFQISYQLDHDNPDIVSRAYLDNINDHHCSLDQSVARIIAERLSDLVNEMFQPAVGRAFTIHDVLHRRAEVNAKLCDLLEEEMDDYATNIISVIISDGPFDAVPNGFMSQYQSMTQSVGRADDDIRRSQEALRAGTEVSNNSRTLEMRRLQNDTQVLTEGQKTEQQRKLFRRRQAIAELQPLMVEQKVYARPDAQAAELLRQTKDRGTIKDAASWLLFADRLGIGDFFRSLAERNRAQKPKP